MNQHVCSLVLDIVGNNHSSGAPMVQTFWLKIFVASSMLLCSLLDSSLLAFVKQFHQLSGLAAGSSAHVQNGVPWFDVQEKWWDHRDFLLTRDVTAGRFG